MVNVRLTSGPWEQGPKEGHVVGLQGSWSCSRGPEGHKLSLWAPRCRRRSHGPS